MRLSEARSPTEVRGRAIRRVWLAAAAALILLFALQGLRRIALESDLRAYAYEDLLGQIHLHDGWMARRFLAGDAPYAGTGRNLAVNLLFAPVARLSPDYPQEAKRLNLAVSCAALGALLFFARRRFGEAASLVAGLLFVLSGVVVFEAARSAAEPLLMLCVVLAWGLAGEGRW
ncbi:MAG: hypothetical protein K8I02_07010, partial [Candidatus Methylomirabilis sp.]|nr:hypothetical protein [Deltaproteobacteria bacterium]